MKDNERIQAIRKQVALGACLSQAQCEFLIKQLEQRDKTIAELQNDVSTLCKVSVLNDRHENELLKQNTLMLSVLERISAYKDFSANTGREWPSPEARIARNTIAQVGDK